MILTCNSIEFLSSQFCKIEYVHSSAFLVMAVPSLDIFSIIQKSISPVGKIITNAHFSLWKDEL